MYRYFLSYFLIGLYWPREVPLPHSLHLQDIPAGLFGKWRFEMKDSPKVKAFSLEVRLTKLRMKHQTLKARIAQEMRRPSPCSASLQMLKRQRLRIKDEIVSCAKRLQSIGQTHFAQQEWS